MDAIEMMLSPGTDYLRVPRDMKGNIAFRLHTLDWCEGNPERQRAVMECCKNDILFFISVFVLQFNPKRVGREVEPFIPWDFQGEAIKATMEHLFEKQRRVVWEKSRELGATWLALIIFVWCCLFHDWKTFFCISHSEQAVDSPGKKNTLFWKIDFILEYLPDWMTRGVVRRKLSFEFPATHSSIEGGATTERSGVGGRNTALLLDEFSKHPKDYQILGQTADTGPCLIIGTHYGTGSAFYDLTNRTDPPVFKVVMHWSQHPEKRKGLYKFNPDTSRVEVLDTQYQYPDDYYFVKDGSPTGGPYPGIRSPWYDAECIERCSVRDVAMHLDINPKGSASQWYDALMIHRLKQKCWEPLWVGELHHERDSAIPVRLVESEAGALRLWINPTYDGKVPPDLYGVAADISTGEGSTPSCLTIVKMRTGEKVGEYAWPWIAADKFAVLAVSMCKLFCGDDGSSAFLVWEMQGPGLKFGTTVIDTGFRHVYYRIDPFNMGAEQAASPGWYPAPESQRLLHEDYRSALAGGEYANPSERSLDQCLDYRYDGRGNPEHPNVKQSDDPALGRVNHGDMVVADALSWLISKKHAERKIAKKKEPDVPIGSLQWRREQTEQRETFSLWV